MRHSGYFTFQMIIGCWGAVPFLSFDAVFMGSPVIILFYEKKNKQVHKNWNFQLE